MGTRSLTFVYTEDNEPIINLYRQYDGYPEGHGAELARFLNEIEAITHGIRVGETRRTANGMGCLAAQLVAHFKVGTGQFYLHPVTHTDCGQDYEYHIGKNQVIVKTWEDRVLFQGNWQEFAEFCTTKEEIE